MSSAAPRIPAERLPALDLARGLAVLGMIGLHLVATEGGTNGFERGAAAVADLLYGKPAALFCALAGVSWAIQAERSRGKPGFAGYVLRRALLLFALGLLFGRTLWSTEILSPLACMMPLTMIAVRGGTAVLALSLIAVLGAMPVLYGCCGEYAITDWDEDGTLHRAEQAFGWITLRYYLYSGNYPLVGWLAFPLAGALLARCGLLEPRRAAVIGGIAALCLPVAVGLASWTEARPDRLGDWAPQFAASWVPTTIPFVLVGTAVAIALIGGLVWGRLRAPRLAALGRTSLTQYVLHVLLAVAPLRLFWPEENWPIGLGAAVGAGYVAIALPLTTAWLRRFRRGPLETAWARAAASPLDRCVSTRSG